MPSKLSEMLSYFLVALADYLAKEEGALGYCSTVLLDVAKRS